MKEDLIRYYLTSSFPHLENRLLPSRKGVIDSNLITSFEAATLVNFIHNKECQNYYRFAEIPFKFRLLLRGSQDGFSSAMFHLKCIDKGPTIVVIRVSGSRQIVGGFNPIKWKLGTSNCANSFIFSFNNMSGKNIISRVVDYKNAIKYLSNGLFSGFLFGGGDLAMYGNDFKVDKSCYCRKTSYQESIMESTENFSVDEFEVFELGIIGKLSH